MSPEEETKVRFARVEEQLKSIGSKLASHDDALFGNGTKKGIRVNLERLEAQVSSISGDLDDIQGTLKWVMRGIIGGVLGGGLSTISAVVIWLATR